MSGNMFNVVSLVYIAQSVNILCVKCIGNKICIIRMSTNDRWTPLPFDGMNHSCEVYCIVFVGYLEWPVDILATGDRNIC